MINQLLELESRAFSIIPTLANEETLIEYKNTLLGKTGELTQILK
jgi:hypothetical protein